MFEIIAIGSEVVAGYTVNSNAAFISQKLGALGWKVARHTAIDDSSDVVKAALEEALARSDIVITTGGLGPTCDDQTREIVAELFNTTLELNHEVKEALMKRYGAKVHSLENQATIPKMAKPLHNSVGTAPGLILEKKGKILILLPGVPFEMKELFEKQVIPYLAAHFPADEKKYVEEVHICIQPEGDIDKLLRKLQNDYPRVEVGIYPNARLATVRFKGSDKNEVEACVQTLMEHYSTYVYSRTEPNIARALQELLREKKLTLALAESCTGGAMAKEFTQNSGASAVFLGSLVVYSNAFKNTFLGVELQNDSDAVSQDVIKQLIKGLFAKTKADLVIAVSGIAGPDGGTKEKPVGTVWGGIAKRGEFEDIGLLPVQGNREAIILKTIHFLCSALYRRVAYGEKSL